MSKMEFRGQTWIILSRWQIRAWIKECTKNKFVYSKPLKTFKLKIGMKITLVVITLECVRTETSLFESRGVNMHIYLYVYKYLVQHEKLKRLIQDSDTFIILMLF